MKRTQIAVILGQGLSFLLIVVFIFANQRYDLMAIFGGSPSAITARGAYVAACLVSLMGVVSIWITFHYLSKSNEMQDRVVVCAWTQRVKVGGKWVSLREFLSDQLGFAVTHGMCPEKVEEVRREIGQGWRSVSQCETSEPEVGRHGSLPDPADA